MSYIFTSPFKLTFVEDTPFIDHFDKRREQLQTAGTIDGNEPAEILFITSYPPVENGTATYSQELIKALTNKFSDSFTIRICALESGTSKHAYPDEVSYILDTNNQEDFIRLALDINRNDLIQTIFIQHEFVFFRNTTEKNFITFLYILNKPIVIVFHTILPKPDEELYHKVQRIAAVCNSVVVMTNHSSQILINDYHLRKENVTVIAFGTHLVRHTNKDLLKEIYGLKGRKVLSTFGLLSSGKSIETTLDALPCIVTTNPDVIFLVIGKTHPEALKSEGEKYRRLLEYKVEALHLQHHVNFINDYLPIEDLLEYLQLTDIYLYTSTDPKQAVSGTFAYAMSCACPIISTPVPQAIEVLRDDTGIIVDFRNPFQLAAAIERLLNDNTLIKSFSANTLLKSIPCSWENSAIAHASILEKVSKGKIPLHYRLPEINLAHVKKMTSDFAMFRFASFNQPEFDSGHTLDDNASALIAICMHYELTGDVNDITYLRIYLNFITYCQQPDGQFLNYTNADPRVTVQNSETKLSDSNGRAVWSLGYLISQNLLLPSDLVTTAELLIQKAMPWLELTKSARSMAFAIKGLYYYNCKAKSAGIKLLVKKLANRLVQMYRNESELNWHWFESYLTYANSVLPEALLCAWLETGEQLYKDIARESFDFLLANTFNNEGIKLISNRSWLYKGKDAEEFGELPVDVAYTILALNSFYSVFEEDDYVYKLETAFNWFLGNNHLHQIIYNPCTGGCYDGLAENHVNLNQGAESTLSYLMARLTIEKRFYKGRNF